MLVQDTVHRGLVLYICNGSSLVGSNSWMNGFNNAMYVRFPFDGKCVVFRIKSWLTMRRFPWVLYCD